MKKRSKILTVTVLLIFIIAIFFAIYNQSRKSADPLNGLDPGNYAPAFTLQDLNGKSKSLQDFRGKIVLVNVWASWCDPCKKEVPAIVEEYNKYKDQGFVVLGVNYKENPITVQGFANQYHMNFPILLDQEGSVAVDKYKVGPLPTSYFIDQDGSIRYVSIGEMSKQYLENTITKMLANK